jgi:hypothetical protein
LFFLAADRAANEAKNKKTLPKGAKEMNSQQIAELTTKAIEELSTAMAAGKSETLTAYLAAIGRFHKYSLHNVMLIVLQKRCQLHQPQRSAFRLAAMRRILTRETCVSKCDTSHKVLNI